MYDAVASSNATQESHSRKKAFRMCAFKTPLDIWTETEEGSNSKEPQIEHFYLDAQTLSWRDYKMPPTGLHFECGPKLVALFGRF